MESEKTLSPIIDKIPVSPTLKITSKAREMKRMGVDVIDLSIGEPDFPTPEYIKEAGKEAIDKNFTKYTSPEGIKELREIIGEKFFKEHKVKYEPEEIIICSGAKQCLFNLCNVLLDEKEEVIIPAPYWTSYPEQVKLARGRPVIVETKEENGFKLTPEELKKSISFNTKAIILNNPSNPTGTVYSKEELQGLVEVALKEGIYIIADEIYEKLIYESLPFCSVAELGEEVKEKSIIINGVSKVYSMTGWRIGYALGPKKIIQGMIKIQSHSTSNACSISQVASLEAMKGPQFETKKMVKEFEIRRNYIYQRMKTIPQISVVKPMGAFYIFPNFSQYYGREFEGIEIRNSYGLAYYLLKHAKIAVVPGATFGMDNFIRFSYATKLENIKEGMDRLYEAIRKLERSRKIKKISIRNNKVKGEEYKKINTGFTSTILVDCEHHLSYDNYYEWNANIAGVIIQLKTNSHHLYEFWIENWYPAQLEATIEPHGIVYAVKEMPGREGGIFYFPEMRRGGVVNSEVYENCRKVALAMVSEILGKMLDTHSVRGVCLEVKGRGVIIMGDPGVGKYSLIGELLKKEKVKLHSYDFTVLRYQSVPPIADVVERKYYVKVGFCKHYPRVEKLFERSKCENVVVEKQECVNIDCEEREDCKLEKGVPYCFLAGRGRSMLDPYWLGGPEKHTKRVEIGMVVILRKDKTSPTIQKITKEEALEVVERKERKGEMFFNPYILEKKEDRIEVEREYFRKLFESVECYLLNTEKEGIKKLTSIVYDLG